MKALSLISAAIGLSVISFFAYNYQNNRTAAAAWSNQKWGDVADAPKTVALKPGQWMRFGPFPSTVGSFRYDVNATLPLSTGLLQLDGAWPKTATCYEGQVFNTVKSCGVNAGSQQFIVISDSRTQGAIVAGVLLGNKQVAMDNRVSITTYHWGCVADCVK